MEWTEETEGLTYRCWTPSTDRIWTKNKNLLQTAGFFLKCVETEWRLYFEAYMQYPCDMAQKRDQILNFVRAPASRTRSKREKK
jgi:hypothetical protein